MQYLDRTFIRFFVAFLLILAASFGALAILGYLGRDGGDVVLPEQLPAAEPSRP